MADKGEIRTQRKSLRSKRYYNIEDIKNISPQKNQTIQQLNEDTRDDVAYCS